MDDIVKKHRDVESKKKNYDLTSMVEERGNSNRKLPDFLKASSKPVEEKQAQLNHIFEEL
jgi:hypothetical protein